MGSQQTTYIPHTDHPPSCPMQLLRMLGSSALPAAVTKTSSVHSTVRSVPLTPSVVPAAASRLLAVLRTVPAVLLRLRISQVLHQVHPPHPVWLPLDQPLASLASSHSFTMVFSTRGALSSSVALPVCTAAPPSGVLLRWMSMVSMSEAPGIIRGNMSASVMTPALWSITDTSSEN